MMSDDWHETSNWNTKNSEISYLIELARRANHFLLGFFHPKKEQEIALFVTVQYPSKTMQIESLTIKKTINIVWGEVSEVLSCQ